mmetsp:Transcript_11036/g.16691  ORF Transcript_11036/g.16691 Transcript_11036/m.16691 type:complete len:238 (-) Transcript_11036:223-936(-)
MPPKRKARGTTRNSRTSSSSSNKRFASEENMVKRNKKSAFEDNVMAMFSELAGGSEKFAIDMEGISKLCEQIDIDPESDVRVLVLLWKLGANDRPGEISKEEFLGGCTRLGVDSASKIQGLMPSLDLGFLDREEFKGFYKFCFQFQREGTHRTLDTGLVSALLDMLLKGGRIPSERLETFIEYLDTKCPNTRITLDQWTSFLEFAYEVEDLADYDEDGGAWPVLLDEYVEWMASKNK